MAVADSLNQVRAGQFSIPSARRLYAEVGATLLPPAAQRWSLRVELKDEEIARLYAQGLTRGALVWRSGMPEWRPLLITPELSRLLHRTPITLRDVSEPGLDDEVTLPRPARLPSGLGEDKSTRGAEQPPTVAPIAFDVASEPPGAAQVRRRRPVELAAVAALSFGLAWFARGTAAPEVATDQAAGSAVASAPAPEAAPSPPAAAPLLLASGAHIPTVALTDLPLLSASGRSAGGKPGHAAARSRVSAPVGSNGNGPTRAQLMAALGQVANVASGCGERGGPVRVVIAFAPSGVARSIHVSGKELPSQVRSCIIGAASRARVASFSGEPVTVSKTL